VGRDGPRRSGLDEQELDDPPAGGVGEGAEGPVEGVLIFNDTVND
jgi:hypothetical protein